VITLQRFKSRMKTCLVLFHVEYASEQAKVSPVPLISFDTSECVISRFVEVQAEFFFERPRMPYKNPQWREYRWEAN
jgi:hypothetical protein